MNKIPKYKSKSIVYQPYIKVTKKESLDKNNIINKTNTNITENNKTIKISQNKAKNNGKELMRKFGEDISSKIKNSISPNITHYHKNRKGLSNVEEKVNN